jgi:hypothetical protein
VAAAQRLRRWAGVAHPPAIIIGWCANREAAQKLNIKEHMVYASHSFPPQMLATAADVEGHHIVLLLAPLRLTFCVKALSYVLVCVLRDTIDLAKNGQFYLVDLSRVFPPEAPDSRSPRYLILSPCTIAAWSLVFTLSRFVVLQCANGTPLSSAPAGYVVSTAPMCHRLIVLLIAWRGDRIGEALHGPAVQRRFQVS